MGIRIDWDIYEEAILVYYYLAIEKGAISREKAKTELSHKLRNKALKQNLVIDTTYRNENGMLMKLANIMFLFSDGKKGLSSYSKLDKEIYDIYRNDYIKFQELLKKGLEMTNLGDEEYQVDFEKQINYAYTTPTKCIIFNKEISNTFTSWSSLYLMIIKTFYKVYPLVIKPNIYLLDKKNHLDIVDDLHLYQLRSFSEIDTNLYLEVNLSVNDIISRLSYLAKICNLTTDQIKIFYKKNITKPRIVINTIKSKNEKSISKLYPATKIDSKKNEIKNNFIKWLLSNNISKKTSEIYSASVSRAEKFAIEKKFEYVDLYTDNIEIIKETTKLLVNDEEFLRINKQLHNQLSSALCKLYEYSGIEELFSLPTKRLKLQETEKIKFYDKTYEKILSEKFQKGYRFGSIIDQKKFIAYLKEETKKDISLSGNEIDQNIKSMGIMVDERVYLTSTIFPDEKKESLINSIKRKIENGAKNIYFDILYEDLIYDFEGTNIFSPEMLAAYLKAVASDFFIINKNYLTSLDYEEQNPVDELRDLLKNEGIALSYNQIYERLPHITETKIRQLLNFYPEFINNGKESCFHKDIIHLTEKEISGIRKIIDKSLSEFDYLLGTELIEAIKKSYPSIFDNNSTITDVGLRKYFSYLFDKEYSFNGDIISYKNKNLKMSDVFANFCKANPHFTINELYNINNQIYLATVYRNSIRINQQEFIGHISIKFPKKEIDDAIGLFCLNKYVPIKAINQYGSFPDIGFSWNEYLLESYVFNHSEQYKLIHNTFNENVCVGAIVKKNCEINNADELFADVLANSSIVLNSVKALDYLCDEGFLARRNYKGIDSIIIKAQELRNKKGKK